MKKIFFTALAIIFLFSAAFIAYGIFLNSSSRSYVGSVIGSRSVEMKGVRVSYRQMRPEILLQNINLRSEEIMDISSRVEGTIEELFVTQGAFVKRGQKLCRLKNADISLRIAGAEANVAKANAQFLQAKRVKERNTRLMEKNAISQSEMDDSAAQMEAAKAELDSIRVTVDQLRQESGFQTIAAPVDGFVIVIYHAVGDTVSKGAPVMMIGDMDRLVFTEMIPEDKIRNIVSPVNSYVIRVAPEDIMQKALNTNFRAGFDENVSVRAKIKKISPPLAERAFARNTTWEIENDDALLEPGIYTNARILRDEPKSVLCVPARAVLNGPDAEMYLADEESRLVLRSVKTGAYNGDYIEITDGAKDGDIAITSGTEGLAPGTKVDVTLED
jgi:RND family efflux transporter MFP subunit